MKLQPICFDDRGVARFKKNRIVTLLLDSNVIDLNHIALMDFTNEERSQFAQLIGYSVSGWGDLSYADRQDIRRADKQVERMIRQREVQAQIQYFITEAN